MQIPALRLGFSISATSRKPRGNEQDGREYYFISDEEFRRRVAEGDFVEYEEVYAGTHYGTLKSEVERVTDSGMNLIMDIDVKGGVNVKDIYGDRALFSVFLPLRVWRCLNAVCAEGPQTVKIPSANVLTRLSMKSVSLPGLTFA